MWSQSYAELNDVNKQKQKLEAWRNNFKTILILH